MENKNTEKPRRLITFNHAQWEMLQEIMEDIGVTSMSATIGFLISKEFRSMTDAHSKRSAGRPRKNTNEQTDTQFENDDFLDDDYKDDLPKNIPHFGRLIGKKELADIEEVQKQFKPKN